jgi:hypothetical protein
MTVNRGARGLVAVRQTPSMTFGTTRLIGQPDYRCKWHNRLRVRRVRTADWLSSTLYRAPFRRH